MKTIKKLIMAFVLLGTVFSAFTYASAAECSVKRAAQQNEITVSGKTENKELFFVQILPNEITPDAIENDYTKGSQSIFAKTLESNENGEFGFNVKVPKSGEYVAYIRAVSDDTFTSQKFVFTIEEEKDSVASEVINKLNNGESIDAVNYIKDLFCDDTVLINYIDELVNTDEQNSYFCSKMKKKGISDYDDLALCAKKALILTATKNSNGPANLKKVMESYKDIIGISSLTDKMSVYTAIKGEYSDIPDFKAAYDAAVKPSQGSVGSGGSNFQGTYTPSGIGSVQIGTTGTNQTAIPINIRFEDLTSVEWAYRDISELFDKGIVNGVSEHLFRPNNQVKREEFVKMIVCAMGLQNEEAQSAGFADVNSDAWFEPYVNIAKKFGISNGTDNGNFGAGIGISRQDMAVMIYNAMKLKGYVASAQINIFADKSSCGDYANEAIAELCNLGIINGIGDNMFEPNGEATRAQAAVIINRALTYLD